MTVIPFCTYLRYLKSLFQSTIFFYNEINSGKQVNLKLCTILPYQMNVFFSACIKWQCFGVSSEKKKFGPINLKKKNKQFIWFHWSDSIFIIFEIPVEQKKNLCVNVLFNCWTVCMPTAKRLHVCQCICSPYESRLNIYRTVHCIQKLKWIENRGFWKDIIFDPIFKSSAIYNEATYTHNWMVTTAFFIRLQ